MPDFVRETLTVVVTRPAGDVSALEAAKAKLSQKRSWSVEVSHVSTEAIVSDDEPAKDEA
jgi:hypothetical protein